jgi:hypothetical protein
MAKIKDRYTDKTLLMERIERNYEDFKRSVMQLDDESIFEYAPTIAAVQDAHFYMSTHDWADGDETEYLLMFENPLKLLADVWQEESEDRGADFGGMLDKITNGSGCEDYTESYVTVSLADELRDKYGDDMPLDAAIIHEILELGRKLLRLQLIESEDLGFPDDEY